MKRRGIAGGLATALLLAACHRTEKTPHPFPAKAPQVLRLVSYHLYDWGLQDRDGDFQVDDPKPLEEQRATLALLRAADADLLLLRGFETPDDAQQLAGTLAYPYRHICPSSSEVTGQCLAVFSRFPLRLIEEGSGLTYRIKSDEYSLAGRFQHLEVDAGLPSPLQLLHTEFKDKAYHEAGQNEMRRNDARLLRQYLAGLIKSSPATRLVLGGSLHDDPDSATVREVLDASPDDLLKDARPLDSSGTAWTVHDPSADLYQRTDYLLHTLPPQVVVSSLSKNNPQAPYRMLCMDLHPRE